LSAGVRSGLSSDKGKEWDRWGKEGDGAAKVEVERESGVGGGKERGKERSGQGWIDATPYLQGGL
jgi:hypothetical protein